LGSHEEEDSATLLALLRELRNLHGPVCLPSPLPLPFSFLDIFVYIKISHALKRV